jgi:hypothetical protein
MSLISRPKWPPESQDQLAMCHLLCGVMSTCWHHLCIVICWCQQYIPWVTLSTLTWLTKTFNAHNIFVRNLFEVPFPSLKSLWWALWFSVVFAEIRGLWIVSLLDPPGSDNNWCDRCYVTWVHMENDLTWFGFCYLLFYYFVDLIYYLIFLFTLESMILVLHLSRVWSTPDACYLDIEEHDFIFDLFQLIIVSLHILNPWKYFSSVHVG